MENTKLPLTITFRVQSHGTSQDGKSSYEFCKKLAKKLLFVHHQSVIPKKSKINFIRNEWKCIKEILTTKHENEFNGIPCLNSYPENNINQTNQRDSWSNNTEWSYLKIPCISEWLNHKIANIFPRESITVRIAHCSITPSDEPSPITLLSIHAPWRSAPSPTPIYANGKTSLFQVTCINCNQLYIGRTIHFLHDCIREHLSNKNSSVKKHISICLTKDHLKRYWNQDHHTRKQPHKLFTNILHKKHILFHIYI